MATATSMTVQYWKIQMIGSLIDDAKLGGCAFDVVSADGVVPNQDHITCSTWCSRDKSEFGSFTPRLKELRTVTTYHESAVALVCCARFFAVIPGFLSPSFSIKGESFPSL